MHEMKHCSNLSLGQNCNQVLTPQLLLAENCNFLEKNRFVLNYCMTRSASYMYGGYAHTHHCRPYLQGVINVPFKNIHFSKYFSPIPGVLPFQFCLFVFSQLFHLIVSISFTRQRKPWACTKHTSLAILQSLRSTIQHPFF